MARDEFDLLTERWPSAFVAVSKVAAFTGGVISGKTLQNKAALGEAVPKSIRVGGKRVMVAADVADYLRKRARG